MLILPEPASGLTSVSLGVIRVWNTEAFRLSVFKPIAQPRAGGVHLTRPPLSFARTLPV
ncbi:AAA family ATPase [Salmonella enterica subsp. enterica]|nr:AAA family ATPase [Salmonella enterica subsp. enterica]